MPREGDYWRPPFPIGLDDEFVLPSRQRTALVELKGTDQRRVRCHSGSYGLWEGLHSGACQPLDGVGHVQGQILRHDELEGFAGFRAAEVDGHLGPVRADGDAACCGLTPAPSFSTATISNGTVVIRCMQAGLLPQPASRITYRASRESLTIPNDHKML